MGSFNSALATALPTARSFMPCCQPIVRVMLLLKTTLSNVEGFFDCFLYFVHSPVASFTINISVIFRKVSRLQQFLTAAAVKTKFVKNFPFGFYFLCKVN